VTTWRSAALEKAGTRPTIETIATNRIFFIRPPSHRRSGIASDHRRGPDALSIVAIRMEQVVARDPPARLGAARGNFCGHPFPIVHSPLFLRHVSRRAFAHKPQSYLASAMIMPLAPALRFALAVPAPRRVLQIAGLGRIIGSEVHRGRLRTSVWRKKRCDNLI
jgi:hypothetical protein